MATILTGMVPEKLSRHIIIRADLYTVADGSEVHDRCEPELTDLLFDWCQ